MGKIKDMLLFIEEFIVELAEEGESMEDIEIALEENMPTDAYDFYQSHKDLIWDMVTDSTGPLSEARGLKGDVLRPWGGRRRRAKMGYGKGGRANYDPEEDYMDFDDEEEGPDIISTYGPHDTPIGEQPWTTKFSAGNPKHFNKKHSPDEWGNDPKDFRRNLKEDEQYKMEPLTEYWDDVEGREWRK